MTIARFASRLLVVLLVALASMSGALAVDFKTSPEPLVIETEGGPVSFTVELALTNEERAHGLMNRATMPADHGMLFDFGEPRGVTMWMRNTVLPLDMIFIDASGVITGIAENTVPYSERIIASPGPVRFVLEVNAGESARRGIEPGNKVSHPQIPAGSQ